MKRQHLKAVALACMVVGLIQSAGSQTPEKPAPASPTSPPSAASSARPLNLKALSKDISSDDVHTLMQGYTRAIGAPCGYCHEENPQTKKLDFASDANPMKETARLMIRMTSDINNRYLAQLGDRRYAEPLTCGNCHQGHPSPPAFEPKP